MSTRAKPTPPAQRFHNPAKPGGRNPPGNRGIIHARTQGKPADPPVTASAPPPSGVKRRLPREKAKHPRILTKKRKKDPDPTNAAGNGLAKEKNPLPPGISDRPRGGLAGIAPQAGSYPPGHPGRHRDKRRAPRQSPGKKPYLATASSRNWLQVG